MRAVQGAGNEQQRASVTREWALASYLQAGRALTRRGSARNEIPSRETRKGAGSAPRGAGSAGRRAASAVAQPAAQRKLARATFKLRLPRVAASRLGVGATVSHAPRTRPLAARHSLRETRRLASTFACIFSRLHAGRPRSAADEQARSRVPAPDKSTPHAHEVCCSRDAQPRLSMAKLVSSSLRMRRRGTRFVTGRILRRRGPKRRAIASRCVQLS